MCLVVVLGSCWLVQDVQVNRIISWKLQSKLNTVLTKSVDCADRLKSQYQV